MSIYKKTIIREVEPPSSAISSSSETTYGHTYKGRIKKSWSSQLISECYVVQPDRVTTKEAGMV